MIKQIKRKHSMNFIDYLKTNHNIILNPQQEQAVLTIEGATLLLAVPGSGKTTVIIARIGNMMFNHSIPPEQILTLTFSVAAAHDMQERFVSIFGNSFEKRLKFKTIHSFCFMVIREYERLANTNAFDVLENNNQIIKQIYLELNKEYIGEDIIKDISQKIGYCKNMMLDKESIEGITLPDCDFYEIYKAYEEYKKQNQKMDYDDMLNYAYVILNKFPEILTKFQNQFKYVNIDEAQDTSFIQHEIIRILVQKSVNIFMVGDEDQSIYGFRAAFPKALLDFENNYNGANVLLMERNYRSTKKVVEAASRFIKQNKDRYKKNMFSENAEGVEIKQTELKDLNEQYKYITDLVKNENNKSIAILYRNNDSAVPIVDALEHEDIPFFIRENKPTFFSHFVINDIICFIRLAQNNADIEAFEKIYYKMNCSISKQMFEYARENLRGNVFDALLEIADLKDWIRNKINELKSDFIRLKELKPLQAIEYIEYKMGYSYNLNSLAKKGYAKEPLVQKLNALKSIASNRKSLDDFVNRLSQLENIMQNSNSKLGAVTLTTVHSSKGLEFDKVIMLDIIDGQFPSQESIKLMDNENNRSLFEEEVRLFYVGITRARNELEILTSSLLNEHPIRTSRFVKYLMYKPKEAVKHGHTEKPKNIKAVSDEEIQRYTVEITVVHKTFGNGIIKNIENEIIDVEFEKYGLKKLSLLACLENQLINITDENGDLKTTSLSELRDLVLHIGNTGENADVLIELFKHADYEIRRRACSAVKKLNNKDVVRHIAPCLYAEEPQIRQYALSAVLKSKCTDLVDEVIKVREKEDKDYNKDICDKIIALNKEV